MSNTVRVDPYPRLDSSHEERVRWLPPLLQIDGREIEPQQLPNEWDHNCVIRLQIRVQVAGSQLAFIGVEEAHLTATVACRSTGWSTSLSRMLAPVEGGLDSLAQGLTVEVPGEEVAGEISVEASIIAPWGDANDGHQWLTRRIIASRSPLRLILSGGDDSFPTSALSFQERNWRPVPWRLDILSQDPADAFKTSVRLYLNEDFPSVRQFISGNDNMQQGPALRMMVMRSLIQHAVIMCSNFETDLDSIAIEFPESLAAAAKGIAVADLKFNSLTSALNSFMHRPDIIEMQLMQETGYLK